MQAVQAVDAEGSGVEYLFVCLEDNALSSGWLQNVDAGDPGYVSTPWAYQVAGLVLDETYTFYVKTRDRSLGLNETAPSALAAVTIVELDVTIPEPSPAQWEQGPSHQQGWDEYGILGWYHYMRAEEATDDSGVEYRFVCEDDPGKTSPWQNADNVIGIINPDYSERLPNEWWVYVGSDNIILDYHIEVRDRAPVPNYTDPSSTCRPETLCYNDPVIPPAP